jgi:hypothetical protein
MVRHRLSPRDRGKRRGDRRLLCLLALQEAEARYRKNDSLPPGLTAYELAEEWAVHPTSALRVLLRLINSGAVERAGTGLGAVCWITDAGHGKIEWLSVKAQVDARNKKNR